MKRYKNLVLVGAMISFSAHARTAIELGQYLSGNYVDQDGRTLLHKLAQCSCGGKFVLKLDSFDFYENKMPVERPKLEKQAKEIMFLHRLSPEFAIMVAIAKMGEFMNTKDNNGETALDLARKSRDEVVLNGGVPHARNQLLIDGLEMFEVTEKNEELVDLMESAVN